MLIPLEEIVRSVTTENPWWSTGQIPKRFSVMARRAYFDPFKQLAFNREVNRAIILLGPRRVGKTVMTQHLVQYLVEEEGVDPQLIMYVSIDTPTYTNQSLQFFVDLHEAHHNFSGEEQRFIIFDEIQYLADWERHLKVLVDKYPNIRFIASGSAAAALRLASTESGAGRFTEFMLPPLTFDEYLRFIGRTDLVGGHDRGKYPESSSIAELNQEFVNYINYGGYPEAVVSEYIRNDAARFIKNDIIDKVLLRDLPQLYGITNIQELNKLFTSLAYQTGQEVSLETLAQNSGGISKPTISKYIEYLEAAFLIFRIRRIDDNGKTFTRDRTFKVYLTNPSMRAALFSPLSEDADGFGHLVETAIVSQWFHSTSFNTLHYARWKRSGRGKTEYGNHGEIDLVNLEGDMTVQWFIEIKWSDSAVSRKECWQSVEEFTSKKKGIRSGVFTTKTISSYRKVGDVGVSIVPSSIYAYVVGKNTAMHRGNQMLDSTESTIDDFEFDDDFDADFDDDNEND